MQFRSILIYQNQQSLKIKVLKLMTGDIHPLLVDIVTEIISSGFVSKVGDTQLAT
jgi:hypothetical protein